MTATAPLQQDINAAGVARMTRMLSVLQPALSTLGTTGGNFRPEVILHLWHSRRSTHGRVPLWLPIR